MAVDVKKFVDAVLDVSDLMQTFVDIASERYMEAEDEGIDKKALLAEIDSRKADDPETAGALAALRNMVLDPGEEFDVEEAIGKLLK
jgi:hypothetical protein